MRLGLSVGLSKGPAAAVPAEEVESSPINLSRPAISGDEETGATLTASQGVWNDGGTPILAYYFQWFKDGDVIPGATHDYYVVPVEDADAELSVEVVAENYIGQTGATSDPTGAIELANQAPINTVLPTIAGIARSLEVLALSSNGTWVGNGAEIPDFDYQWLADGVELSGETGTTLSLTDDNIGQRISLRVYATNSIGTSSATSLQTSAVIAPQFAPAIVVAPAITGAIRVDNTLQCSQGTWNDGGEPIDSYAYQWFEDGVAISGENTNELLLTAGMVGAMITCSVTATNDIASTEATATAVGPILAAITVPTNTVAPDIDGTTRVLQILTCTTGTWNLGGDDPENVTYEFQWQRLVESVWVDISGADLDYYQLTMDDYSERVRCRVTATNTAGASAPKNSSSTPTILLPVIPSVVSAPVISGDPRQGETLTVTPAVFDEEGAPITSITREWQRGTSSFTTIPGETGLTYVVTADDVGLKIRVRETATNLGGNRSSISAATATVQALAQAPINTVAPVVSGTTIESRVLSTTNGTWTTNIGVDSYEYQWLRDGYPIDGATANTYTLLEDDVGAMISCEVTAINTAGDNTAASNSVGPITGITLPSLVSGSEIDFTGSAIRVGRTMFGDDGTWDDGDGLDFELTYQWYADGVAISGADAIDYVLTDAEEGAMIVLRVTGTNEKGSTSEDSAAQGPVIPLVLPATNTVAPNLSPNLPLHTDLMTTTNGTWNAQGGTVSSYLYQWYADSVAISGEDGSTFQLTDAQIGAVITVGVRAVNEAGPSDEELSDATSPVMEDFGWEAETNLYLAAMDTIPDFYRQEVINNLVVALKNGGVWSKLELLCLHAAHDEQTALLNVIRGVSPTQGVKTGSVTFTADLGFVPAALSTSNYIDWDIAPNAMPGFSQNSGTVAAYCVTNLPNPGVTFQTGILGLQGADNIMLRPRASSSGNQFRVNSSANITSAVIGTDIRGLIGAIRRAASGTDATVIKRRTNTIGTSTQSSTAESSSDFTTLRSNAQSCATTIGATVIGSALSDGEWDILSDALDEYMAALGVALPDDDALNYFAAMATQPDDTWKQRITDCIIALKAGGVYAKLDWLVFYCAQHQASALINVIDPTQVGVVNGTISFVAEDGIASNGTTGFIQFPDKDLLFLKADTDNLTFGVWSLTDLSNNNLYEIGGTTALSLCGRNLRSQMQATSVDTTTVADSLGMYGARRNNSSSYMHTKGRIGSGGSSQNVSKVRTSVSTWKQGDFITNAQNIGAGWSTRRIAIGFAGEYLTDAEWNAAYDAFSNLLTDLGAI